LNMTMTSVSGLPPEAVLLVYIDSRMGRNGFQSINDSISASLSPTDRRRLYSSLRAKSVKSSIILNLHRQYLYFSRM
jgi:hypothetical protein